MKLNQNSVSKLELEDKVRETRAEPKPPGGPSNIDNNNEQIYKQRLFNWLVAASKGGGTLYAWCLARRVTSAVATAVVTKQDLKLIF